MERRSSSLPFSGHCGSIASTRSTRYTLRMNTKSSTTRTIAMEALRLPRPLLMTRRSRPPFHQVLRQTWSNTCIEMSRPRCPQTPCTMIELRHNITRNRTSLTLTAHMPIPTTMQTIPHMGSILTTGSRGQCRILTSRKEILIPSPRRSTQLSQGPPTYPENLLILSFRSIRVPEALKIMKVEARFQYSRSRHLLNLDVFSFMKPSA